MKLKSLLKRILIKLHIIRIVKVHDVTRPYQIILSSEGRFRGQIVVVTGGSGQIGRAICFRLAAEGAHVIVCGSNEERTNTVVKEIRDFGFDASPCLFNLHDPTSIESAFKWVLENYGRIDTLVTCAGGSAREDMCSLIEQKVSIIDDVIMTNLRGSMLCVQQACRFMNNSGGGNLILISSTVGIGGMPRCSEYAAAKAGVNAFMKSIAMEYGPKGIRCNCVSPGIVQRGTIDDIQLEHIAKTNWLNSYGKPEDIANMVAYLNSEEASFITGQNFVVDGGRSLGLKGQN